MKPEFQAIIDSMPTRSAWARGVKDYAADLLDTCDQEGYEPTKENMLNGAQDWNQWAYGGCGLVYDSDIADRMCSPSEFKRVKGGDNQPNSRETWLDVEARAVHQACCYILRAVKRANLAAELAA